MDYILEGLITALGLLASGHAETWSAVWATVRVSTLSILAALLLGAPLGFVLGYFDFFGKRAAHLAVNTCLSLPTVVIGLVVYALITSRGPLGSMGLLFTLPGIAVGQTILGLPIVAALTARAVEALDTRLSDTLLTLGARRVQMAATVLWEARYSLLLAAAAAYGRIVSEVGISMMVGGNIKWHTRTITTAIALETNKGRFAMGIALGAVLMLVALSVNLLAAFFRRRAGE
jgi:tungstate transport system permease protein